MTSTTALLVDTWGWLTLRDRRERKHLEAKAAFEETLSRKSGIFTTDFVLDETFTLLFRRLPFHDAKASMELLTTSCEEGAVTLVRISPARFQAAQALRLKFKDKPLISFTDLCTMAVMRELEILRILTEDKHFEQVGLGLQLVP